MTESRQFKRHQIPLEVEYSHASTGTLRARARDMSEGGLFLIVDESFQLKVGSRIVVRTLGLGPDGEECGPDIVMKVVRCTSDGMGLEIAKGQASQDKTPEAATTGNEQQETRTLLQRLLVIDSADRVLLWHKGDHWHLPCRVLQPGESWQEGIDTCIAELKQQGALSQASKLQTARQCVPATNETSSVIEFLVPCRYPHAETADDTDPHALTRWVDVSRLDEVGYPLEQDVFDNLGIKA